VRVEEGGGVMFGSWQLSLENSLSDLILDLLLSNDNVAFLCNQILLMFYHKRQVASSSESGN